MPASQLIAFRPPMQKGLQVHTVLCGLLLSGCLSPITLNRAVVVYDEAVTDALAKQLLINIARAQHHQPIHFTGVSNIAATFDFRVNAGATPALTGEASARVRRNPARTRTSRVRGSLSAKRRRRTLITFVRLPWSAALSNQHQ